MPNGEFRKKEVPPSLKKEAESGEKEHDLSEIIRAQKEIAGILRIEREDLFNSYKYWSELKKEGNPDASQKLKQTGPLVEMVQGAEKDLSGGSEKWTKELLKTIEHIVVDTSLGRPSDPAERKKWEEHRLALIQKLRGAKVTDKEKKRLEKELKKKED